jgi:CheY-like chemotaxis protein
VESEAGEGSTCRFTATFALSDSAAVTPPSAEPSVDAVPAAPKPPLTLLVVEDDEVHRELLAATLALPGHTVITACNGHQALQELSRTRVDMVLMDFQMPLVDGFKAAATIRNWEKTAGGHLPIIGMTASALVEDEERCRTAGMDRFVTKPINKYALFSAIDELRGGEGGPAALPPELAGRPAFLSGLGDDVDLARKLVSIFLEQSPKLMDQIRDAIDTDDAPALRRAAHALKGTISNFPLGPARGAAAQMEGLGFDGDLAGAREALPLLQQEVDRLTALLPAMI